MFPAHLIFLLKVGWYNTKFEMELVRPGRLWSAVSVFLLSVENLPIQDMVEAERAAKSGKKGKAKKGKKGKKAKKGKEAKGKGKKKKDPTVWHCMLPLVVHSSILSLLFALSPCAAAIHMICHAHAFIRTHRPQEGLKPISVPNVELHSVLKQLQLDHIGSQLYAIQHLE